MSAPGDPGAAPWGAVWYNAQADELRFQTQGGLGAIPGPSTVAVPTASAGAQAGTSPPSPTFGGGASDLRGEVLFSTGSGTPTAGAMVQVNFGVTRPTIPACITLTPVYLSGGGQGHAVGYQPSVGAITTSGFTIYFDVAPPASTQFACMYEVKP